MDNQETYSEGPGLERRNHLHIRDKIAIWNRLERERICKYWTRVNKSPKPRDLIYSLYDPNLAVGEGENPQHISHSKKMMELARDYNNNIQDVVPIVSPEICEAKIELALGEVDRAVDINQSADLAAEISKAEIKEALKSTKNSSAPGLDGITYEFWKSFASLYDETKDD